MKSTIFKSKELEAINLDQEFLNTVEKAIQLCEKIGADLASDVLTELKAEVYASKSKLLLQQVNELIFELTKSDKGFNYRKFIDLSEKLAKYCSKFEKLNPVFNSTVKANKISEFTHHITLIIYSIERAHAMKYASKMGKELWFELLEVILTLEPRCTSTTLVRAQNRLEILSDNYDVRKKLLLQALCEPRLASQELFTTLMANEFNAESVEEVLEMLREINEDLCIKEIESYLAIHKAKDLVVDYDVIKETMKHHFFNYIHNGTLNGSYASEVSHRYGLKY